MSPKKLLASGLLAAVLASTAATIAIAPAASADEGDGTASTCLPEGAPDTFPAAVDGAPGRSPGVSVWRGDGVWHVRVTHNALHDRVFSGVIHTRGTVSDVTAVGLERNDHVKVGADKHTIAFRFNNYGRIDGVDFTTTCAPSVQFGFLSNGHRVPPKKIAIGGDSHHPKHDPFVIRRTAAA
jgi:hypothetical protein